MPYFKLNAPPISIIFLIIVIASCGCDEIGESLKSNDIEFYQNNSDSKIRTIEEAIEIALNIPTSFSESNASRSIRKNIVDNNIIVVTENLARGYSDTLLYIVNYENEEGFAIIATPKEISPVIAYVEEGYYDPEDDDIPSGFSDYLYKAKKYIQSNINNTQDIDSPFVRVQRKIDYLYSPIDYSASIVNCRWGQSGSEGKYCPNGKAGCGPIAAAQILSFFEEPQNLQLTFYNAPQSSITLDWEDIKKHYTKHKTFTNPITGDTFEILNACEASESAHNQLALLCREIGQLSEVEYNTDGSSTIDWYINNYVLTHFISNCTSTIVHDYEWDFSIVNSCLKRGPALVGGYKPTNRIAGHIWVCDGAQTQKVTEVTYEKFENELIWKIVSKQDLGNHNYLHFNWGWYGKYNGWFEEFCYNNQQAWEYDNGVDVNDDEVDYSYDIQFFFYK